MTVPAAVAADRAPLPSREVGRLRFAVGGTFMLVGIMLGGWFARIPQLRIDLGLSNAQLGTVLLAQTMGVVVAMQVAGGLSARLGSRTIVRVGAVCVPWFPPLVASMPGIPPTVGAMFAWGLCAGVLDVAMNAQGVLVERAAQRQVLNSLHAAWGVGALLGALSATAAVHIGLSLPAHFIAVAIVLMVVAMACGPHLLADPEPTTSTNTVDPPGATHRRRTGLRAGWTRRIMLLGSVGAAAAFCEGAVSSWCGVFLQEQRGAPAKVASLAYTVFILALTGTRAVGDHLHDRLGAVLLVRCSVVVAAIGLIVAVALPPVALGVAGFVLLGCGLAVLVPIICGAVGHGGPTAGSPAATSLAIARFSTMHYGGVVTGPSLVGWLAGASGLSAALSLLLLPLAAIGICATATSSASIARSGARTESQHIDRVE